MSVLVCSELRDDGLADPKSSLKETRASAYNAGKRERRCQRGDRTVEGNRRSPRAAVREGAGRGGRRRRRGTTAEPEPLLGQRHVPGEELAAEGLMLLLRPRSWRRWSSPSSRRMRSHLRWLRRSRRRGFLPRKERPPREQEEAGRRWLWEAEDSSTDEPTKELYPFSPAGQILAIMRAGRVASTLGCDRDTWEFVAAHIGNHSHFRTPGGEEYDGYLVKVVLSGRPLAAVLLSLHRVAATRLGGRRRRAGLLC